MSGDVRKLIQKKSINRYNNLLLLIHSFIKEPTENTSFLSGDSKNDSKKYDSHNKSKKKI